MRMKKAVIPESHLDLLLGKHFASVATVNPDGSPHVTPMWVDYDQESGLILLNTAKGRVKARNMKESAFVSLCIIDSNNPYRYLSIIGKVARITEKNAEDHIRSLAERYTGSREFPLSDDETRIIVQVTPLRVIAH